MPSQQQCRLERLLRLLALGLSALLACMFLWTALRRLHYPFELDRMESGMMTSVWRLRHGYPLYSAPSLQWASFLYAPIFFYLSAALSKLTGLSYVPLRLVSILATLGSFGAIFAMVWGETRRLAAAVVAVGVFASLYMFVLGWFDIGRVDSLSVCLFLLALLATRRTHPLLAALVWLLAFQTKQTFLPLGIAIFLVEWQRPKRMLTGMVAFAVMAWGSVLWLNHVTHHWYSFYAFGTVGVIGWDPRTAAMFVPYDLISPWPVVFLLIVIAVVLTPMHWRDRDGSFFAIVTFLLTAAIWYVRAHAGANVNATIPLYAWMSILLGIAVHRLLERCETSERPQQISDRWRLSPIAMLWLALAVQLAGRFYRPGEMIPGDRNIRQQFLDALRATPGDVWVVNHSYDGILAGKPVHAEMDALDAVLGGRYPPASKEFDQAIEQAHFTAVVMDRSPDSYAPAGLFTSPPFTSIYGMHAMAPGSDESDLKDQPKFVMLPCSATQLPQPQPGLLDLPAEYVDQGSCQH